MAMFERELPLEVVRGYLEVGVCNVVDVLDHQFGLRQWLSHEIKPIFKARAAGQAVTLLEEPKDGAAPAEVGGFYDACDLCGPGRILFASMGGDRTLSITGDLVVTALHARGCEAAVLDGAVRDIDNMIEMGFPVFARAISPVDKTGKARTVGVNVPLRCGEVVVNPGDVVVADWDGVVVVPLALAEDVLARARALVAREGEVFRIVREGARTRKLRDIFAELKAAQTKG